MFLASRTRRGPDRYLRWKTAALVIGALLVLVGARLGRSWLVWSGIGVLAVGFALRFVPQREPNADDERTGAGRDETA